MITMRESTIPTVAIPRNRRAMMRGLKAVSQHRDWWIALGRATPESLVLGGVSRPWRHDREYADWQSWQSGDGSQDRAQRVVAAYDGWPDWWINLTRPLSDPAMVGLGPKDWDNAAVCPNLERLRWVSLWPWQERGLGDPVAKKPVPVLPKLSPWMAPLEVGVPISCGRWFRLGEEQADLALDAPWLIKILIQTIILQALGGGYWDQVLLN